MKKCVKRMINLYREINNSSSTNLERILNEQDTNTLLNNLILLTLLTERREVFVFAWALAILFVYHLTITAKRLSWF